MSTSANQGWPNISSTSLVCPRRSFLSFTSIWKWIRKFSYFWNQISRVTGNFNPMLIFRWPPNWGMLDQVIHLMLVLVVERRDPDYHFIDQNTQCPPINCVVMARAHYHLRRQVFGRSTKWVRLLGVVLQNFC
jgi:hypothetical protein